MKTIKGTLFYMKMKFLYSIGKSNIKTIRVKVWCDKPDDFTGIAIDRHGDKHWWLDGKSHREDGPAIERADGYKAWYLNGKCHREDGPASGWANGSKSWYLNGAQYTEEEHKKQMFRLNRVRRRRI